MTSIVTLANKSYAIGTTRVDSERRRLYFENPGDHPTLLNAEERRILTELGIDASMKNDLRPFLADFFDALPMCQSDAALTLSADCEVPQYVLWATRLADQERTLERLTEQDKTKRTRTDIAMAMDDSMIRNLKEKVELKTNVEEIFTLIDVSRLQAFASQTTYNIPSMPMEEENEVSISPVPREQEPEPVPELAPRAEAPKMPVEQPQEPSNATVIQLIFTLVDLERGDMLNLKSLERIEDA